MASPPPHYNFAVVPTVRSLYPLWDDEANVVEPPPLPAGVNEADIHMPSPSYWPILLAAGITMASGGLLVWQWNTPLGLTMSSLSGLIGLYSVYRWVFEPAIAPEALEGGAHH